VTKVNKIVYLALSIILIAMAVLAYINRGDIELKRALEENREFLIRANRSTIKSVNMQMLLEMDPQEFTTSFATSITSPRDVSLRGVELRIILQSLEIDFTRDMRFVVTGLDGYHSALTYDEVMEEELVYICFVMDGEFMKTQGEGGYGPFLMVIRGSRFAQRWCKYVEAVDIIT